MKPTANETVAEIVKRVRRECSSLPLPTAATEKLKLAREFQAAHNREIAAKNREIELLGMALKISNGMNDAAAKMAVAKDAEIAHLRECLKPILSVRLCDGGTQPISDALCAVAECKTKWRKCGECAKFVSREDAEIAELRRRLKVTEAALTELQDRFVASVHDGTINPYEALKIAEDALAAIREPVADCNRLDSKGE